jgi:hypothetical protein
MKEGRLADLSISGARVEAQFTARVLSRVQIAIVLPRWHGHLVPFIDAYVARRYEDGFGIEWCEFAPRSISELLRRNAAARSHGLHRQRLVASPLEPPPSAHLFNPMPSVTEAFGNAPELLAANGI